MIGFVLWVFPSENVALLLVRVHGCGFVSGKPIVRRAQVRFTPFPPHALTAGQRASLSLIAAVSNNVNSYFMKQVAAVLEKFNFTLDVT